tara:strand:- start:291 stop:551 length:261 start_codon:yes stop_codon:yes gene_type:complete
VKKENTQKEPIMQAKLVAVNKKSVNEKKKYTSIVDKIEEIRKNNNKNWMNLLRIALESSPKQSKLVLKKINTNDKKISKLFSELAN